MKPNISLQNHEESDAALKEAIQAFPEVVPLLADKADISLPAEIRGDRVFQIATEGFVVSLSAEVDNVILKFFQVFFFSFS